jgi:hypothetical protein
LPTIVRTLESPAATRSGSVNASIPESVCIRGIAPVQAVASALKTKGRVARMAQEVVSHAQDARSFLIGADRTHVPIDIIKNGKRTTVDVQLEPLPKQATP